jgi:O-antigen ligase
MSRARLLVQLEGALQVLVAGLVVAVALGVSNLYPLNIPIGRTLRWVVLAQLAAIALVYAAARGRRRAPVAAFSLAAAFLALAGLSAFWSPEPRLTAGRAVTLAVLFLTAAALAHGTRGESRPMGQILLAVLAGAVLIAVGGLVELAFRSDLAAVPATIGTPVRYNGLGGNPNTMAMLLALAVPLGVWAFFEARSRLGRLVSLGVVVLLFGSFVASGSRGALLSAVLGSLVAAIGLGARAGRRQALVWASAGAALALGLLLMAIPQPASRNPVRSVEIVPPSPVPFSRLDAETVRPLRDEISFPRPGQPQRRRSLFDTSGRFDAWRGVASQAADRPLAGYGFGTEERVFVDRFYFHYSTRVENSFLATLLQLGVAGLALLAALLVSLVVPAWRARARLPPEARRIAAASSGVVAAGIVLAVTQSFLTSVGSPATAPFWICAFLLAALGLSSGAAEQATGRRGQLREGEGDERQHQTADGHRKPRLDVMRAEHDRVHEQKHGNSARSAAGAQGQRQTRRRESDQKPVDGG